MNCNVRTKFNRVFKTPRNDLCIHTYTDQISTYIIYIVRLVAIVKTNRIIDYMIERF